MSLSRSIYGGATGGGAVASVAGKTGAVSLVKADVGLGNVDNTSDSGKPVSAAQAALNAGYAPLVSPALTGTPTAPTPTAGDSSTQLATTAFVAASGGSVTLAGPNSWAGTQDFTGATVTGIAAGINGSGTGSVLPFTPDFYVDPAGSDSHDGLTVATAWASLAKVVASAGVGVKVGLRRGGVWRESLTLTATNAPSVPLVIGAYGTGNAPQLLGSVAGSGLTWANPSGSVWSATVVSTPAAAWRNGVRGTLKGSTGALAAAGDWYVTGTTVSVYATATPVADGWEFSQRTNVVLGTNVDNVRLQDLDLRYAGAEVIRGTRSTGTTRNWEIARCTVRGSGPSVPVIHLGTFTGSASDSTQPYHLADGVYVHDCYLSDGYRLVYLTSADTFRVHDNLVECSGRSAVSGYQYGVSFVHTTATPGAGPREVLRNRFIGDSDILSATPSVGGTIAAANCHYVTIAGNHVTAGNIGLHFDETYGNNANGSKHCIIRDNRFDIGPTATASPQFALYLESNSSDNRIFRNLFSMARARAVNKVMWIKNGSNRNQVIGNTLVGQTGHQVLQVGWASDSAGQVTNDNVFRNNIFYLPPSSTSNYVWLDGPSGGGSGNLFDHNAYTENHSAGWNKYGTFYATLAAWQTGYSQDANSVVGDPLFTSTATFDYTLQAASPAKAAGLSVAGINDGYGIDTPDIGFTAPVGTEADAEWIARVTADDLIRVDLAANPGGAPSGAASGSLSGTYPSPGIARIDTLKPTAATYENFPRSLSVPTASTPTSSARLQLNAMWLPAGLVVHSITFFSGSTAATTPTHQWFALYDSLQALLRQTTDDTTTAWGTSAKKTLALTSDFTTTYSGLYYVGICVVANAVQSNVSYGATGNTPVALMAEPPVITGYADTGLVATAPNPAGTITAGRDWMYCWVTKA